MGSKRGLSVPKVITQKMVSPVPKGDGLWVFASKKHKALGPFSEKSSGSKHIKSIVNTSTLAAHKKWEIEAKSGYLDIYTQGHQSPYNMAYGSIEGPIVSLCKHAKYGSSRAWNPRLIVHAYGHVCKVKKWHRCSQGNTISNHRHAWKI